MTAATLDDVLIEHNGHMIKSATQADCLKALKRRPVKGYTSAEMEERLGLDHGKVSGALSVLNKRGLLALLQEKRAGFMVYVLTEFVNDRPTRARKA